MDPNATLTQLHEAIQAYRDAVDAPEVDDVDALIDGDPVLDAADQIIELHEALDEWLAKGGFLPTKWEHPAAPQPDLSGLREAIDTYREACDGDSGDAEYEAGWALSEAVEALLPEADIDAEKVA
jgi:hypothetical protein